MSPNVSASSGRSTSVAVTVSSKGVSSIACSDCSGGCTSTGASGLCVTETVNASDAPTPSNRSFASTDGSSHFAVLGRTCV